MAKIKDLTPKGIKLKTAEQEFQVQYSGDLPFGQNMGGTQMYSNVFKRGYGDKVFGSSELGIWLGAADFENAPNRQYMDGSVVFTSATITGMGLNFVSTLAWTATDRDTATWSSGAIKTSAGDTYAIDGGNTGNVVATTYVYLDPATSTTVLQTSTTATDAVGDGKILLATVEIGAVGSECLITVSNSPGTTIDGDGIVTGSVTADKLFASYIEVAGAAADVNAGATTINGGKITAQTITSLGAVTAGSFAIGSNAWHVDTSGNMWWGSSATYAGATIKISTAGAVNFTTGTFSGSVTGATITGSLFRTASSGDRIEIDSDIVGGLDGIHFVESTNDAYITYSATATLNIEGVDVINFNQALLNEVATIRIDNNKKVLLKGSGGADDGAVWMNSDNNLQISNDHSGGDIEVWVNGGNFKIEGVTKTAIVPTSQGYRALYCMESPEVWFMDFCEAKDEIDSLFLEVTEGEMKFIKVEGGGYQVWRRRKGQAGYRFEEKTKEEYYKNNEFWAGQRP